MSETMTPTQLEVRPGHGGLYVRAPLTRVLTSIGSDPAADVRVAGLPERWALVQREENGWWVRLLNSGRRHQLVPGRNLELDGICLSACMPEPGQPELPTESLAQKLAEAENPSEGLQALLTGLMEATRADSGAIILREPAGYSLALALSSDGERLPEAGSLLSDSIVREVLTGGRTVRLADMQQHAIYARVPSVQDLHLEAVLCVPMQLYGKVMGAIYLGRRLPVPAFTRRQSEDLENLASMAVPLLVQLRRIGTGTADAHANPEALLLGECEGIGQVRDLIQRVGPSDLSVLIRGATGTGKELVARAVHAVSNRAKKPMVAINCAAVPEGLLAGELFGAKKGAYTGAGADRKGLIEQAHGSTLFLDEVGDMPAPMQASLLRVLETREVVRLGEHQTRQVDFRLISASHKNLEAEVVAGRFREDLLFRLQEFTIGLPSLAERDDDVLLLAQLFMRQAERQLGLPGRSLSAEAKRLLREHPWPGNIRELKAAIRRAAVMCDGGQIQPDHLKLKTQTDGPKETAFQQPSQQTRVSLDIGRTLAEARDTFVRDYVKAVLEHLQGNRRAAASALGISIRSLYRHLA